MNISHQFSCFNTRAEETNRYKTNTQTRQNRANRWSLFVNYRSDREEEQWSECVYLCLWSVKVCVSLSLSVCLWNEFLHLSCSLIVSPKVREQLVSPVRETLMDLMLFRLHQVCVCVCARSFNLKVKVSFPEHVRRCSFSQTHKPKKTD